MFDVIDAYSVDYHSAHAVVVVYDGFETHRECLACCLDTDGPVAQVRVFSSYYSQ